MSDITNISTVTAISKYGDDKVFSTLSSGTFLPLVQLMGSNSELAKEGKIGMGRWALVRSKEDFVDLGAEANLLILGWRPKAMDTSNKGSVRAFYNPQSEEFKSVIQKSDVQNSGCFFGPEYLVYLPNEKVFASLLMASKTARREAPNAKALIAVKSNDGQIVVEKKFATLKCRLIKSDRYSWHGPIVTQCSTQYDLPPTEEVIEQLNKFNNPPEDDVEVAPDDSSGREV